MKFTDGFWQTRAGFTPLFAQEAYDIRTDGTTLEVIAPTRVIQGRGDVLNRPALTVTVSSPAEGSRGCGSSTGAARRCGPASSWPGATSERRR